MNSNFLSVRYINYAGYEIRLANGAVIALDPCHNLSEESCDESYYGRVDYILLSHTHYDHTKDIPVILKQNEPKIVVGARSASALAKDFDLDLDRVYPLYPDQKLVFQDFTIRGRFGKHKFSPSSRIFSKEQEMLKCFPASKQDSNLMGSMEYLDYEISIPGGIRIFISGGGVHSSSIQNIDEEIREFQPMILFRQTSSKHTPEEFAHVLAGYGALVSFPLHHDGLAEASGMSQEEYFDRVNRELEKMGLQNRIVNPWKDRWYDLSLQIS